MPVPVQDPPNGALECKVDGVATTTVVTIGSPVLMMDEIGVLTLTYESELVGMTRGGFTLINATAVAETVFDEAVVICDEGTDVSLFIDSATNYGCPGDMIACSNSPQLPTLLPPCCPSIPSVECASGRSLQSGVPDFLYCQS